MKTTLVIVACMVAAVSSFGKYGHGYSGYSRGRGLGLGLGWGIGGGFGGLGNFGYSNIVYSRGGPWFGFGSGGFGGFGGIGAFGGRGYSHKGYSKHHKDGYSNKGGYSYGKKYY